MFYAHSFVLIIGDLDNLQTHIAASFVNSRVSGGAHDNFSRAAIVSVGFHGEEQTFSAAAGHVSDCVLISVEEGGSHADNLIFNDS